MQGKSQAIGLAMEAGEQSAVAFSQREESDNIRFRNFCRVSGETTNLGFGQPMFWHLVVIPFRASRKAAMIYEIVR